MSKLIAIIATILVVTVLLVEYGKYVSDNQTKQTIVAYLVGKYSE